LQSFSAYFLFYCITHITIAWFNKFYWLIKFKISQTTIADTLWRGLLYISNNLSAYD